MAKIRRRRRGKIRITRRAQLVHKNDKTRVERSDIIPNAPARLYRDNAANFKIKIRKK